MEAGNLEVFAVEILWRIRSVSGPERIIIFGSCARGNTAPRGVNLQHP